MGALIQYDWCPYKKEETWTLRQAWKEKDVKRQREKTAICNQEIEPSFPALRKNPTLLTPGFQTSSPRTVG